MDIQQALQTGSKPTANASTENRASLTSDYEMFLKMLTTQMTNQDPLNPVDSSDYAVQLATFSSVEQQVLTNELLVELTARMSSGGLADLGNWIGREVRTTSPAYFDGAALTLSTKTDPNADSAKVIVRDAQGIKVDEQAIPTTSGDVVWAGQDRLGDARPNGLYTFSIESYRSGELLSETQAGTYARITEARTEANGVVLVLPGDVTVAPDQVTAIRR